MPSTPCYIFDLDGTLANGKHREHFLASGTKRWDEYFALAYADEPIPHIVTLAEHLAHHAEILFVSGRIAETMETTVRWLEKVFPGWKIVPDENLFLRSAGDFRNDDVVKVEILARIRSMGFAPLMTFDDRNRVVKAWRAAGVPCAQVAEGDF